MHLIAVGRTGSGPHAELFAGYAKRLRPKLILIEVAYGHGSPVEIKRREAALLLAALPERAFAVALDIAGDMPDSAGFSATLERWLGLSRPLCFLIGGAEGIDASVLARADARLSLGRLTWPHMLARVMLAEQLFRARAIAAGHPYHRADRP